MKALSLIIAILTPLLARAQGTVIFANSSTAGTSHVWAGGLLVPPPFGQSFNDTPSGTTPYAADGYFLVGANGTGGMWGAATTFAQLLGSDGANQPESSLVPVGLTTTFRTGAGAGTLSLINDTLQGIPKDSPVATLEMVVWDNSSGLYSTWNQASVAWLQGLIIAGKSGSFNVQNIGGVGNPSPSFFIPTFAVGIPEPGVMALGAIGMAACIMLRRRQ